MKFLTYSVGGETSFGLAAIGGVIDLKSRLGVPTLKALIAAGGLARAKAVADEAFDHAWDDIAFEPVIPEPDKIICIGVNYEEHRAETGRPVVAHPTVFTRFFNTQVGHEQPIVRPKASVTYDFEGELAVIIGTAGRAISEDRAFDHVAGYACYNDVSVRDFQSHTSQFTPGKNFPATGPFGPFLVTPDEVGPLGEQRIQTRLNGVVVQDAHLNQMIFNVPKLIAYCSIWTELKPGDVIVTGTPGGVGARRDPPLWMKPGDEIVVEIEGVGQLVNRVVDEG
jgi:2-keto-4-pentenoate hydratase/2-oxohepta-3-ene-1,7-dioic acid hydratase in catechol pathway